MGCYLKERPEVKYHTYCSTNWTSEVKNTGDDILPVMMTQRVRTGGICLFQQKIYHTQTVSTTPWSDEYYRLERVEIYNLIIVGLDKQVQFQQSLVPEAINHHSEQLQ